MAATLAHQQLQHAAGAVGKPGGFFLSKARRSMGAMTPPPWLKRDDLTTRIYAEQRGVAKRGVVRWAAIVHANMTCWRPGTNVSGSQVVTSPRSDVPLERLLATAKAMFALKGTTPADPAERRLADMLTDELERALDWPVPTSLSGYTDGEVITTVVMLAREHMPGGFLGHNFFPVLCDPASGLSLIVPGEYWRADLRDEWLANVEEVTRRHSAIEREFGEDAPVLLTYGAAEQLHYWAQREQLGDTFWLYVRDDRAPGFPPGASPLDINSDPPDPAAHAISEQFGVRVAVPRTDVPGVRGIVVKYREDGSGVAFYLDESKRGRA